MTPIRIARQRYSLSGRALREPGTRELKLRDVIAANSGGASDRLLMPPLVFMMQWEVAEEHIEDAAIADVAAFWGLSMRSAYRAQAKFRAAFPGELNPKALLVRCERRNRALGWRGLAEWKVPVHE